MGGDTCSSQEGIQLVLGDHGGFLEEVLSRLELEGWTMAERWASQGVALLYAPKCLYFSSVRPFSEINKENPYRGLNNLTKVRVKIWRGDCLRQGNSG